MRHACWLVASDGCVGSGLTALIDVLSTAPAERPGAGPSIPPVRIDVTGTGRKVTTRAGPSVPVTMHLSERPAVEVVVVPALGTMTAEDMLSALAARSPGGQQGRRHVTGEDYHQRCGCLVRLMSGFGTPLIGMTGADKQIHRIGGRRARYSAYRQSRTAVRAATTGNTPRARVTRRAFPAFPPHRGAYVHASSPAGPGLTPRRPGPVL